MTVLELLDALDTALRDMFTCTDEKYDQLLRDVSAGSFPRRVEAFRTMPQHAIVQMMQQVESLLGTRTARMSRVRARERQVATEDERATSGGALPVPTPSIRDADDPHNWPRTPND